MSLRDIMRPTLTTIFATTIVVGVGICPSPDGAAWLSAKTVLMVPGNANPDGAGIESKFNGYFDDAHPNFGFPGYDLVKVPWLSDSFDFDPGYAVSQADGLDKLRTAMAQFRDVDDADDVDRMVVVGYSAGAIVVIDEMKNQDSAPQGALSPDQVQFFVFGSPHRPNGGVFARFPGAIGDAVSANPDTRYELTDIGYEYDPISDFPAYPLLPLTLINAAMGFPYLHVAYVGQESDLGNAIDDPNMTYYDETRGIRYITIAAPHLPLLMPLYRVIDDVPLLRPLVEPLLKLVEPALKVLVDLGYRRDIAVGEPVPAGLFPRLDVAKVLADLARSVVAGVNGAFASITGTPVPDSRLTAPVNAPGPTAPRPEAADATLEPDSADDVVEIRSGRTSRVKANQRGGARVSEGPALRDRPDKTDRVSTQAPEKTGQPSRRKDTTADTRPDQRTKSGTAKMDSVRTSDRRQAADAA